MQESSSKIGISVAAPDAKLHIAGTHADESANRTEATVLVLDTTTSGNGDGKTYFKTGWNNTSNNGISTIGVGYYAGGRQVRDVLTMWGNGRVGVGTTSPTQKLHLNGGVLRISGGGASSKGEINLDSGTEYDGLQIRQDSEGSINSWSIKSVENLPLTLGTNNLKRVTILAGGDVGIGTTTPTQKLDVAGNIAWGTDHVMAYSTITTTTTTANQVITAVSSTTYRTAKFVIQAVDATAGKYQSQEIMAIHNGSTVAHTEYTAINVGGAVATYDVDISAGTIRLLCTPLSTNSTVFKVAMYLIKA
jgi:hypothetical protein